MKIREVSAQPGTGSPNFLIWCPACKCCHGIWVDPNRSPSGGGWTFDGNAEAPTIKPSIKVTYNGKDADQPGRPVGICHSVITAGIIAYCADCTHELAGKSVPMEDF